MCQWGPRVEGVAKGDQKEKTARRGEKNSNPRKDVNLHKVWGRSRKRTRANSPTANRGEESRRANTQVERISKEKGEERARVRAGVLDSQGRGGGTPVEKVPWHLRDVEWGRRVRVRKKREIHCCEG